MVPRPRDGSPNARRTRRRTAPAPPVEPLPPIRNDSDDGSDVPLHTYPLDALGGGARGRGEFTGDEYIDRVFTTPDDRWRAKDLLDAIMSSDSEDSD